jgi:DNA-binding MarR family transcriptional regulator
LGTATVNSLAERLDVERTAMGKMIGFLERDGIVKTKPSPTDGRSRIVELRRKVVACSTRAFLFGVKHRKNLNN